MNIQPLSTIANTAKTQPALNVSQSFNSTIQTGKAGPLPFADMVTDAIQQVDAQQQIVAQDVDSLARGETDNLQAIAANVAKADLSFRFLMEIRDKLISSYQEVIRMQV